MPYEKGRSGNEKTQFPKGKSGNPKGRPPKILGLVKQQGYHRQDMMVVFEELIWYSTEDLKKLVMNEKTPAIVKIVANAIKEGMKKGDMSAVRQVLEYTIGRAPKEVNTTNTNVNIDADVKLTPKLIKQIGKALEDEY